MGMAEGLAKQAKTLTDRQIKRALAEVATHRYPERDRVMVLLSAKAEPAPLDPWWVVEPWPEAVATRLSWRSCAA